MATSIGEAKNGTPLDHPVVGKHRTERVDFLESIGWVKPSLRKRVVRRLGLRRSSNSRVKGIDTAAVHVKEHKSGYFWVALGTAVALAAGILGRSRRIGKKKTPPVERLRRRLG